MIRKNRIIAYVFTLTMCVLLFAGCSRSESKSGKEGKYQIVCTTFPQYDWVREIVGENADEFELTLLLDQGVDLHSFQPTAADITKIAQADLFVFVGGESDGWVEDALKEATNKNMKVVNMLECLGDQVKEEEIVEGMESEEEEEEGPEYDEHIWLSLRNASTITNVLEKAIEEMDDKHADEYRKNANTYCIELDALDGKYQEVVKEAKAGTVLFGDRFPFRYLVDDYGLNYYAAFVGCSAETEASFETIAFLAGKMDELNLSSILVIDNSDQKIANAIKDNTKEKNQQILTMNSLQSIKKEEVKGGTTYVSVMEQNLEALKKALN